MQLETTFRGLDRSESATATRTLEKGSARLKRLLDRPTTLRAVVEKGAEVRVHLAMNFHRNEITAVCGGPELHATIAEACDKLKVQLVRQRHRAESQRHRDEEAAGPA